MHKARVHNADTQIKTLTEFGVPASVRARDKLGVTYSFSGFRNPALPVGRGEMPADGYEAMTADMSRLGCDFVVYSYNTVIGWVDGTGAWHTLPYRYDSYTTTAHYRCLCYVTGANPLGTVRVKRDRKTYIGRPGF